MGRQSLKKKTKLKTKKIDYDTKNSENKNGQDLIEKCQKKTLIDFILVYKKQNLKKVLALLGSYIIIFGAITQTTCIESFCFQAYPRQIQIMFSGFQSMDVLKGIRVLVLELCTSDRRLSYALRAYARRWIIDVSSIDHWGQNLLQR